MRTIKAVRARIGRKWLGTCVSAIATVTAAVCLFLVSCKQGKENASDDYRLEATGDVKEFVLDSDVRYNLFYAWLFKEKTGKSYFSFLNYRTNQIYFYDWQTGQLVKKLTLHAEGPDGVVQVSGCYVQDFDHIYVSTYAYSGLIRVDTLAHIVQKIPYGKTEKGYDVLPSYTPSSHPYLPPLFMGDETYISQSGVERFCPLEKTPLTVAVDTVRRVCRELLPTYSVLTGEEKTANDLRFSRIATDRGMAYSFYVKEDLVIAPDNAEEVRLVKAKSRYITSPTGEHKETERGPQLGLELARYGDMIYDPYREVYYRFAYPKTTLDSHIQWWGKSVYGRKKFSIILLDKDFRIIGETLFPEGIYNSYVFLVAEEGLYISRDYQMLTGNSEDTITFERFELKKQ